MDRLKKLREARKLTQKELADLTGLTDRTISGLELGTTRPSVETLIRLRKVLGDASLLFLLDDLEAELDLTSRQKPGRPRGEEKER
jgi:transcriptional regulator with XRE-family HTH domain